MVYRLYLVNRETEKCTGKKRDYPSYKHLMEYGEDTFKRYDYEFYYSGRPTGTKAKLCFLNEDGKWEKVSEEDLEKIKKEWDGNKN